MQAVERAAFASAAIAFSRHKRAFGDKVALSHSVRQNLLELPGPPFLGAPWSQSTADQHRLAHPSLVMTRVHESTMASPMPGHGLDFVL